MTLLDYFNIIVKHWKIVLISVFVCTFMGFTVCFIIPKVYEANGKLLISQDNMNILGGGASPLEDMMLSSLGKSDPLTTQMEILKTRPILFKVIDTLHLVKKGILLEPDKFIKNFKISVVRNTNLIQVECRYSNADSAALIVNTLMQVFVDKNQRMNQEIIKTAKDFIKNQLVSQKLKVEESEQKLTEFKEKYKTMFLDKEAEVNIEAYSNLDIEYVKTQSELSAALNQQKAYKTKITDSHSESNPLYSVWVASSEQLENIIIGLTAKEYALKNKLNKEKATLKDMPSTESQMIGLLREQKIANEIYTGLLSKFEEYKVQEAAKIGSAMVIEPAIAPFKPVIPKKRLFVMLSFLLGLSIGLSLIYGFEYFRGLPHSVEEIKKLLGYSIFGSIPYHESKKSFLYTRDNPSSMQSEAIRLIQTSIRYRIQESEESGCFVILITSTQPGEGKSTIAANLAYSYSSNKKTLLMGMDFRKPSFDKIFGVQMNSLGIADTFDCILKFNKSSLQTFSNLDVIGPGTLPQNPLDLVQSRKMSTFIKELKQKYEVIIIDTAPITMVAETYELVKFSDIVALVVDMSSVSLKDLQTIKSSFESRDLIPGIIVNKCYASKAHYKYSEYKKV